jgi:hypothetical protein
MQPINTYNGNEIILYALKNNCSREIYDLLLKAFSNTVKVFVYIILKMFIRIS